MIVTRNFKNPYMKQFYTPNGIDCGAKLNTTPNVNISEMENSYKLYFAVPGMRKEDFQIKLEDELLSISTVDKEFKTDEQSDFTKREYDFSSFKRSFYVDSSTMEIEKISANYQQGELIIEIPKLESAIPTNRTIEIN